MKKDRKKTILAEKISSSALKQIDIARGQLTNSDQQADFSIHEMRRCLKRLRAFLRLVKREVGSTVYHRDNIFFRDLGRQLSGLRDATVLKQTLRELQEKSPQTLAPDTWRIIKREMKKSPGILSKKKIMKAVATKLEAARVQVENWELEFDECLKLQKGIKLTYRKGRRAMKHAFTEPETESYHEWRIQVNHLRHQLQMLSEMKIGVEAEVLKNARNLTRTLGSMNDLALLSQHIIRLKLVEKTEIQKLEQLIQLLQTDYQAEAMTLGKHLYRFAPKDFSGQMML